MSAALRVVCQYGRVFVRPGLTLNLDFCLGMVCARRASTMHLEYLGITLPEKMPFFNVINLWTVVPRSILVNSTPGESPEEKIKWSPLKDEQQLKNRNEVVLGIEPKLLESESRVLTITPYNLERRSHRGEQ